MHTEHLQNVRPGRVLVGWFVAIAVTSFVYVALAGLGIIEGTTEGELGDGFWALAAVVVGFWFGGLWTGWRSPEAPILHGVAIGLLSLVAWFVLNVVATLAFEEADWVALGPVLAAALVLLQVVAAIAGAWFASRLLRAGVA